MADDLRDSHILGQRHRIRRVYVPYDLDDPRLKRYEQALDAEDWDTAHEELRTALIKDPFLISHPHVISVFKNVYSNHPSNPFSEEERFGTLQELVLALCMALTKGARIKIDRPVRKSSGRPRRRFVHIKERRGWYPTEEAEEDNVKALTLVAYV